MKDYQSEANRFQFTGIPYTKVKALQYCSENIMEVKYKTRFTDDEWTVCDIRPQGAARATSQKRKKLELTMPSKLVKQGSISKEKAEDIQSMLQFMPDQDKAYMQTICHSGHSDGKPTAVKSTTKKMKKC